MAAQRGQRRGGPKPPERNPAPKPEPLAFPVRINRYIARAGVCSRRNADDLVRSGMVRVAGELVTEVGTMVQEGQVVEVNGKRVSPRTGLYLLLHKPADTITTTSDERGRRTVLDLVDLPPDEKAGLFPVGRLDRHTTGVLVLTTDGELAHRLMHPSYTIEKIYKVRTESAMRPEDLDRLVSGIELEDGLAVADHAGFIGGDRSEIGIAIHEGRNRQVRRMFEALGHRIESLDRVRYAGLTAEGIRRGHWRRLTDPEIRRLYRAVKLK